MTNLPQMPQGQAGEPASQTSRARGALYGLAIGDALGMPTQLLSRPQIVARWGPLLTGFEPAPDGHPIAAGHQAGVITDDTEQAVLLGRLLVAGHGRIGPRELADAHGGRLSLRSGGVSAGAVFVLDLPREGAWPSS